MFRLTRWKKWHVIWVPLSEWGVLSNCMVISWSWSKLTYVKSSTQLRIDCLFVFLVKNTRSHPPLKCQWRVNSSINAKDNHKVIENQERQAWWHTISEDMSWLMSCQVFWNQKFSIRCAIRSLYNPQQAWPNKPNKRYGVKVSPP